MIHLLAIILSLALAAPSTTASRDAAAGKWDSPVPIDKIREMVKSLEEDPLAEHADALRAFLLKYFDNMRPEFVVCASQFKPLLDAKDKAQRELWFYIPIASGAYLLDHPDDIHNAHAYQLAGLDGMLRVYERILAKKPDRRNTFLDELIALRGKGTLPDYVRAHMCDGDSSSGDK